VTMCVAADGQAFNLTGVSKGTCSSTSATIRLLLRNPKVKLSDGRGGLVVKKHEVAFRQGNRGICSPLQVAELNFEDPRRERLYDGSHLSSTKSFLRLVFDQRNDVQSLHVRVVAKCSSSSSAESPHYKHDPSGTPQRSASRMLQRKIIT
jgi:hypothetical protein